MFGFTPSLHLCLPICLFVPVAVQVRGGRVAVTEVTWSLAGGFRSVFGAEIAPRLVCEIHLNRFQILLIFH